MKSWQVELTPEAAERLRALDLFDRLEVWNLFEDFQADRAPEENYAEGTGPRRQSVIILRHSAVGFVLDRDSRLVRILSIEPSDG